MGKEPVPAGEGWAGKTVTPQVLPRMRPRWMTCLSNLLMKASRRSRFAQIPQRTVTVRPGP